MLGITVRTGLFQTTSQCYAKINSKDSVAHNIPTFLQSTHAMDSTLRTASFMMELDKAKGGSKRPLLKAFAQALSEVLQTHA